MNKLFLLFAFALFLPSAVALSCNGLSGGDLAVCNSVQSANFSQQDKDLLISDIFNKNKTSPNFDFVYSWNNNLSISDSPNGKYSSSGTINKAWVKILFVSPSILGNQTLFINNTGKIKTEYNYDYNLPSGKEKKDCKTEYNLLSKTETLSTYLNNQLIGNSKISQFSVNNQKEITFISELQISITYEVKHYRNIYSRGMYRCLLYSTNEATDNLQISDSLDSKLYYLNPSSSFSITNNYNNVTRGVLQANNFTNLILSFNNSKYQDSKYIYSLNYSLPNYILTIKAEKKENTQINNIHIDKENSSFYFYVRNPNNCQIQLFTFFSQISKECNMNLQETNFSIKTDRINYYENDTIKVYITPSNIIFNLTYANQTKTAKNYTEFKAVLNKNKISASLREKQAYYFVNVVEKDKIDFLIDFSSLSLVSFIFYRFAKAYYFAFPL